MIISLLGWLFRQPNFIQFDDSFALTRNELWRSIGDAIGSEIEEGRFVLLIVHFTETFSALEVELENLAIDYGVVPQKIDQRWLAGLKDERYGRVFLTLSRSLPLVNSADIAARKKIRRASVQPEAVPVELSCIVCERHPLPEYDTAIERFARWAVQPVRMGHFLALDDPVIRRSIGETTVEVMEQLGLGKHESLVTSHVISRRVRKVLARKAIGIVDEAPADSAVEWYELNG